MRNQEILSDYLLIDKLSKRNNNPSMDKNSDLFKSISSIVKKYLSADTDMTCFKNKIFVEKTCVVDIPFGWNQNYSISYKITYTKHKKLDGGYLHVEKLKKQVKFQPIAIMHDFKYEGYEVNINTSKPNECQSYINFSQESIVYKVGIDVNKNIKNQLIKHVSNKKKSEARKALTNELLQLSLSDFLKTEHFGYARIKQHFGDTVAFIYMINNESPTGVELYKTVSVSEWDLASKEAKQTHQYLVGNEKW